MLAKTMSESPPPSHAFSVFITYQIAMENDEPNIKIQIISLLLARIYRKMENYFCISAEIWLLPDDLRHLFVNSPNHHTQASNTIISVFLTNSSVSMVRRLALQSNSIKRQSVSGRVSEYTWINKQK